MTPKPQPHCTVVGQARAPSGLSIPLAQRAAPYPAARQRQGNSAQELCGTTATAELRLCRQRWPRPARGGRALPGTLRDGGALPTERTERASLQLATTAEKVFQDSFCHQPAQSWQMTAAPGRAWAKPCRKALPPGTPTPCTGTQAPGPCRQRTSAAASLALPSAPCKQ